MEAPSKRLPCWLLLALLGLLGFDGCLAGCQTGQRHAVGAAGHVVKADGIERVNGVRIAAVLAAHAAGQVGVALVTQLDAHLLDD